MTTILIAEDHPIVSEAIRNILQESGKYQVMGVAHSTSECNKLLYEFQPKLLLLDIGMPDGNALDQLPQWLEKFPDLLTFVVSCYGEHSVIHRALEAGAKGYVVKESPTEYLLKGIEMVLDGKLFLCPIAERVLKENPKPTQVSLTLRERQILALIVEGLPIKQIADRLGLTFETVHSYTKHLRAKMGVNNTAALVRKALEQRLV